MDQNLQHPCTRASITIAGVAIALLLYVAAYLSMLVTPAVPSPTYPWRPRYRFGQGVAKYVFGPVHFVDRKLRPDVWQDWEPGRWED